MLTYVNHATICNIPASMFNEPFALRANRSSYVKIHLFEYISIKNRRTSVSRNSPFVLLILSHLLILKQMSEKSSNNKRIAKNTLLLYMRSLIVMIITLYTSRVILHALGIEDYGLFNVVGGVVGLFAFLRTSMTKSTQRFLNVEMAKPDGRLKETFSVSLTIHVIISIIALVLAETVGLWFLNTYIQIPEGRELAANVVYQSTVFSLIFTILSVPYNASIIAHERMGYFAVVSVIDAFLKLAICYMLYVGDADRLIVYGWLMMGVNALNFILYAAYCLKRCPETSFRLMNDKGLFKEMLSYTTWTVVGQVAIVGTNQGNNILMNMFHSVTTNAAMGVATQVNSAVISLTSSFQTAFNPQITKSYAVKDYGYLKFLVYSTSKFSYFILFIVCLPIAFNINWILSIWLTKVPLYADIFCVLILCNSILNALSAPLNFCVLSSGKIKWFQIATSIAYLLDLLILFALFNIGFPPETALYVKVSVMVIVLFIRLFYANREVECINMLSYGKEVLFPVVIVSILSIVLGMFLFCYIQQNNIFLNTLLLVIFVSVLVLYVGLNQKERMQILKIIKRR